MTSDSIAATLDNQSATVATDATGRHRATQRHGNRRMSLATTVAPPGDSAPRWTRLLHVPSGDGRRQDTGLTRRCLAGKMAGIKSCCSCGEFKPAAEFARKRDGLNAKCRPCQAAYAIEHYRANKAKYIEAARRCNARTKIQIRAMIHAAKDAPCLDCGQSFPNWVMDFDHVRGEKSFDLAQSVRLSKSKSAVLAEIAKCELVCSNYHRHRTHMRRQASKNSKSKSG